MMILGIDPGPFQSACVMWDGKRISLSEISENPRIGFTYVGVPDVVVAVEHLQCFGLPVGAEVFETGYWIGEFRRACRDGKISFQKVFRGEVKMWFCNSMKAKDSNIRQALIDRFGKPGTKKAQGLTYGLHGDLWSAFAIAVMTWDKMK